MKERFYWLRTVLWGSVFTIAVMINLVHLDSDKAKDYVCVPANEYVILLERNNIKTIP